MSLSLGTKLITASQSDMVKVFAGKKRKQFNIHKDLLCAAAPYFAKALSGDWLEGNGELHLDEDDPAAFELFVEWIYQEVLPPVKPSETPETSPQYGAHYKLFYLAEKWSARRLKNRVVDCIKQSDSDNFTFATSDRLQEVYANTPPGSILRRYVAHVLAYEIRQYPKRRPTLVEDYITATFDSANLLEFHKDMILLLADIGVDNPDDLPSCTFHEHESGEQCKEA